MSRPEHLAPPEIYYNEAEARKYAYGSRILEIQTSMSKRAIEMLVLPNEEDENFEPQLVLDIGCGSGISGDVLEEMGHYWVGIDISLPMLEVALEREASGDMFHQDMGHGLSFRIGMFDACISISALQWLCNADEKSKNPIKRLNRFFASLYRCLKKGGRAVFQFYPENPNQMELITHAAMKNGFGGGIVVDFPHSTVAKKYFLVLFAGIPNTMVQMPKAITEDSEDGKTIKYIQPRKKDFTRKSGDKRPTLKSKAWILSKKERDRKRGKEVRPNSKYSGRKRNKY